MTLLNHTLSGILGVVVALSIFAASVSMSSTDKASYFESQLLLRG